MKKNYRFGYKNEGNMSFLTVAVDAKEDLTNYQLKMMDNNEIPSLLNMSQVEHNGQIELYYDITSRSALTQLILRDQMNKQQCIKLLEAFVKAAEELPEYQLSIAGIEFDMDYIFVRPGDFDVNFVFIPDGRDDNDVEPVREFLSNLIMKNKIAAGNDNFIASLIAAINDEKFNVKILKKFCVEHKGGLSSNSSVIGKTFANDNFVLENDKIGIDNRRNSVYERNLEHIDNKPVLPDMKNEVNISENNKNKKKTRKGKVKRTEGVGKNIVSKLLFVILQAIFAGIIFFSVVSGLLADEKGNMDVTMLCGIVLICLLVDFIIFRRLFLQKDKEDSKDVNEVKKSKKEKKTKKKVVKNNKTANTAVAVERNLPKSPFVQKVVPERPKMVKDYAAHIENNSMNYNSNGGYKPQIFDNDKSEASVAPNQYIQVNNSENMIRNINMEQETEYEYDATVLMADNVLSGARFTWYENGILKRVKMEKNILVAGRQSGKVDILLPGRMVGHIHAQFRQCDDGRYTVMDFNSKNGTYINGSNQRITSNIEHDIHNGDIIKLADVELTFEC